MFTPQDLKQILSSGLLSFPITDFDAQGDFAPGAYADRLEWLAPYGATALFVAGGTGEFFSLTPQDYTEVVKIAVTAVRGRCSGPMSLLSIALLLGVAALIVYLLATLIFPEKF